jgi:agmatinase
MKESIHELMSKGVIPIGLGGDHSITLASLRAAAKVYGPVAMIHFDSHTDTWDTYYEEKYWHGSPFIRAHEEGLLQEDKVFQIGIRGTLNHSGDLQASLDLGYRLITTGELSNRGFEDVLKEIRKTIGNTPCFLTFDIDFVDPSFAPGTGTPEIGGFSSYDTLKMIRSLTEFNFIGYDVVEVLPSYDPSQITSLLAATLVHEFASLAALGSKEDN